MWTTIILITIYFISIFGCIFFCIRCDNKMSKSDAAITIMPLLNTIATIWGMIDALLETIQNTVNNKIDHNRLNKFKNEHI